MLYNKHNLAVAKIAAKNNNSRPELTGVFFTKDKTAAADGYKLIEITIDKSLKPQNFPVGSNKKILTSFNPFIIPAEAIKKIKPPASKDLPITENVAVSKAYPQQVELLTANPEANQTITINKIEGRFPDYEKIFPQGEPRAEVNLNGKFLQELLSILSELNELKAVKIKFYNNDAPLVLEASNPNQKARALLMPLKE